MPSRQPQARQEKLAVLRVPIVADVRYHDRGNRAQPRDCLSCLVEPTYMSVAGGESAMRRRVA
jgi:hypothetical protein